MRRNVGDMKRRVIWKMRFRNRNVPPRNQFGLKMTKLISIHSMNKLILVIKNFEIPKLFFRIKYIEFIVNRLHKKSIERVNGSVHAIISNRFNVGMFKEFAFLSRTQYYDKFN